MQSPQLDKDFYFFVDKQTSLGKKYVKYVNVCKYKSFQIFLHRYKEQLHSGQLHSASMKPSL